MRRLMAIVFTTLAAFVAFGATSVSASPAPGDVTAQAGICDGSVCLYLGLSGRFVSSAQVQFTGQGTLHPADFHYFGPSGTPDKWQRQDFVSSGRAAYFNNINTEYSPGSLVCGEVWSNGVLFGRPCWTI